MSILSSFDGRDPRRNKKDKRDRLNSIRHDKFDRRSFNDMIEELKDFAATEDRCAEKIRTGEPLYEDLYFALVKGDPNRNPDGSMRPDHIINHGVMGEMLDLNEYTELREWTPGDEIAAALATVNLEPRLETIYDRLDKEQQLAQQLWEQYQQQQQIQQEIDDLDQLEKDWGKQDDEECPSCGGSGEHQECGGTGDAEDDGSGGTDDSGGSDGQSNGAGQCEPCEGSGKCPTCDGTGTPNFDNRRDQLNGQAQSIQEQIEQLEQQIRDGMKQAQGHIRQELRAGMRQASDQQQSMEATSRMWGTESGEWRKMPHDKRIELAQRINNEKFRRLAEIFGAMRNIAFTEQQRKTTIAREEIYDTELGDDIGRMLPSELMKIKHPLLKKEFYRDFVEKRIPIYAMRGQEKVGKGAIICCGDSSGSMMGEPELWERAVSLALLHIARKQKRAFHGIIFGSPGSYKHFDFTDTRTLAMEDVIDFAEYSQHGGTCFQTPLTKALELLQEEYNRTGYVSGDIVFITDGICGVSDDWMKEFKKEQERLDFTVYGCLIEATARDWESVKGTEPLATICDGKIFTIQDLMSGGDVIRSVFRNV